MLGEPMWKIQQAASTGLFSCIGMGTLHLIMMSLSRKVAVFIAGLNNHRHEFCDIYARKLGFT